MLSIPGFGIGENGQNLRIRDLGIANTSLCLLVCNCYRIVMDLPVIAVVGHLASEWAVFLSVCLSVYISLYIYPCLCLSVSQWLCHGLIWCCHGWLSGC